jgi:hypothetical protein
MSEMTQEERNEYVKQMYKNTTKYLLNEGITIPLKKGHNDQEQVSRGFVQNLELKKKNYTDKKGIKVPYYVISAKMFMYKDFYDIWKTGRLPGISIEGAERGTMHDGDKFGIHIDAVTFNGTQPVAQPWLNNPNFKKYGNYNNYKCINFQFEKEKKYRITEFKFMSIPTMEDVDAILNKKFEEIFTEIASLYKGTEAVTNPVSEEPPAEEEMEKVEYKCKDKYTEEFEKKISDEWEKFSEENKIPITSKYNFTKIAGKIGIEFAKDTFLNHMSFQKPPADLKLTSDNNIGGDNITYNDKIALINKFKLNKSMHPEFFKKQGEGV